MAKVLNPAPSPVSAGDPPAPRKEYVVTGGGDRPEPRRREVVDPFVFAAHPDRVVVLGDQVLPGLITHPLVEGVGGCRRRRNGSWDVGGLRDDEEQRGGMLVLPIDYVHPADDGSAEVVWSSPAEYVALVGRWVESGRIPAPTRAAAERLADRLENEAALLETVQPRDSEHRGLSEIRRQARVARAFASAA